MLRHRLPRSHRNVRGQRIDAHWPSLSRWFKHAAVLYGAIASLLMWSGFGTAVDAADLTEYQLKAAFLYTVAKFVEWPAVPTSTINLCIAASDPFAVSLTALEGKPLHNVPLKLNRLTSETDQSPCHILILSTDEIGRLSPRLRSLGTRPILTVSETEGFAKAGGMLELVNEDNRIKFEINLAAAQKAQLKLNAQMLTLARALYTSID